MAKNTYILSLGGSIIVPEEVDVNFLKGFKKVIDAETKKGNRFVIITGGGKVCRKYQHAAKQVNPKISAEDVDWIGLKATQFNGVLVSKIFEKKAKIIKDFNPKNKEKGSFSILVSAGYAPGHSTDYDAVVLAKTYGAHTVINLSNIDYVYDKDPKLAGAKKLENISWKEMRKIVGSKWSPGLNAPFDPVASKFAQENGLKVIVMNGKNLSNLSAALNGKKFKGTIIEN
jgi:uridylate kinase